MPWLKFTAPFNWQVRPTVTIHYKAGRTYLVTRRCASEAMKARKAQPTERPKAKRDDQRR